MCMIFFFNDTATTEIYTLSLHDALPISPLGVGADGGRPALAGRRAGAGRGRGRTARRGAPPGVPARRGPARVRSEEHTSELQSRQYLVCRLLLEKKNNLTKTNFYLRTTS